MDRGVKRALLDIKKAYKPERMILFGSQARGDTHEGSDVDIIIIKRTDRRFLDRIGDVLDLWNNKIPLEPIVYTPEEFENKIKTSSFIQTVLEEGIEV